MLGSVKLVFAIATQGRVDAAQWVTKYKVKARETNENWDAADAGLCVMNVWVCDFSLFGVCLRLTWFFLCIFVEVEQGANNIFTGNTDSATVVWHVFQRPIRARYVRLCPTEWSTHISLRWDLLYWPLEWVHQLSDFERMFLNFHLRKFHSAPGSYSCAHVIYYLVFAHAYVLYGNMYMSYARGIHSICGKLSVLCGCMSRRSRPGRRFPACTLLAGIQNYTPKILYF